MLLAAGGSAEIWSELVTVAPHFSVTDLPGLVATPSPIPGSLAWKLQRNQRINILVLARGGAGHDNPDFTDTIVVLSIRPASGRATLVSIPRFLLVDIPAFDLGGVTGKLYSAYALGTHWDNSGLASRYRTATGAGDLAAATVTQIIGEPIDVWACLDIPAFRAIVDALGGIRLRVPSVLDDPSYPEDGTERTIHIHFDNGVQMMDGTRALQYARSRLSTSEADRSMRQELVLAAIIQRLRTVKPGLGPISLLGAIKDHVRTNMDLTQLRPIDALLRHVQLDTLSRVTIDETNVLRQQPLPDGDSALVPRAGTFTEVQKFVQAALP